MKLKQFAHSTEKQIHKLTSALSWPAMASLFLMMVLTGCDVFGRYVLNHPIKGSIDISEVVMSVMVFWAIPYTTREKGHVRITIVTSWLSPRTQGILNSICVFVSAVVFALIAWQLGARAWADVVSPSGEMTQLIFIPIAPFIFVGAIGSLMSCLELLTTFFHSLAQARARS